MRMVSSPAIVPATPSIAAASIVAKVTRDRLMKHCGVIYPDYGFERHKGYGTVAHMRALKDYGPTPLHRKSFAPVAAAAGDTLWVAWTAWCLAPCTLPPIPFARPCSLFAPRRVPAW